MRWLVLLFLLVAYPAFAQEEDDDESTIEVESEEPDDDEEEEEATNARKQKPPETGKRKPPGAPRQRPVGKDGLVLLQGTKKEMSIRIPASWRAEQVDLKKERASFVLWFPGTERRGYLWLVFPPLPDDPRGLPEASRRSVAPDKDVSAIRIESRLLPHIIYQRTQGKDTHVWVRAFVRRRGWTVRVSFAVAPEDFDAMYESFLQCALTTQVDRAPWPAIPSGYKVLRKGGFRYASHPDVGPPSKHLLSMIRRVRKRFEKAHGKLPPLPKGMPDPVVFIHASNRDARTLAEWLKENPARFVSDVTTLEFFVTPAPEPDYERDQRLASAVGMFLLRRRYGTALPSWVIYGESMVPAVELTSGKKLPFITLGYRKFASGVELLPLDQVNRENLHDQALYNQSFFYVVYFRCGKAKHKKAYRKFLQDIATHHDPGAAARRHIEPLGYAKLQAAAQKFMETGLKVVAGK